MSKGKKVSIIKLVLFGCACLIIAVAICAWIFMQQVAWKVEWHEGLAQLSTNREKCMKILERATPDCDATNPRTAERMSAHKGYAEELSYDGQTKAGDEQI